MDTACLKSGTPDAGQSAATLLVGSLVRYQLMISHLCLRQFQLAFLTTKRPNQHKRYLKKCSKMEKGKALLKLPPIFCHLPPCSRSWALLGALATPLSTQLSTWLPCWPLSHRPAELLQGRGCVLFTEGP